MSVARTLWWAALYALAVAAGRATALPETGLALFWPAAGVAALWVQRSSRRQLAPTLPVLFATTVVVNLALGVSPVPASLLSVANVVAGLTVRQVLGWVLPSLRSAEGRSGRAQAMGSIHGVVALAQASAAAGVASAPFGVLGGYLITGHASLVITCAWVVRNTTGVFVVAGVVLAVVAAHHAHRPGPSWSSLVTNEDRRRGLAELAVTVVVAGAVSYVVFSDTQGLPVAFLLVAVAALVGFRFSPVVAAVLTTAGGLVAIVASLTGTGPFSTIADPLMRSLVVQAFVLVQAAISLMLSWAVRERHDMMLELTEARRQADERAQLLDAVTDRLEHGVAVIDATGRIVVQNPAAARLLPGPHGRFSDDDHPAAYGVHRADGAPMDLASMPHSLALATGESVTAALVVRRPDADDSYVNVRVDALDLGEDPSSRLAVVSVRDDTEHRRHVDDLETFAGAVAHDLRSPLAAMSSWVEVLAEHLTDQGSHDDGAREALGRITAAGDRMSQMIDDLLAYARAGSAPVHLRDIDLDACVREVADEVIAASGRGAVEVPTGLGTMAGDPSLVRQVLANVIGNAVKYTADDVPPVVHLRADHSEAGVVIRVTDNGVGVPEPLQATVFDRFTRVSTAGVKRPGSGLGLALCARAVQRHDGTIVLTTGPDGVGSTVTMTFPAPPARQRATAGA
ncbi:ATP-binding protein [Nocardioides zeicaulis]|uniref:Sensor-like histidine kinase SenX3 n=1 Tax=Nocardioides zeicaulis TaxID=1776857 RepID=A0ABV6DZ41_9ACTN